MKTAKTIKKSVASKNVVARILSRCAPCCGCLIWPGATTRKKKGYGRIMIKGTVYCCHRIIWTYFNGKIANGKIICHKCDNPLCCDIDHMFIGTQKDNMLDMNKKGRAVKNPSKGVDSSNASLNSDQVAYIKLYAKKGDKEDSFTNIAAGFGVSINTVARVANGVRYK